MNWTEMLKRAGIPESPGREEAVRDALELSAEKRDSGQHQVKGRRGRGKRKGRS